MANFQFLVFAFVGFLFVGRFLLVGKKLIFVEHCLSNGDMLLYGALLNFLPVDFSYELKMI